MRLIPIAATTVAAAGLLLIGCGSDSSGTGPTTGSGASGQGGGGTGAQGGTGGILAGSGGASSQGGASQGGTGGGGASQGGTGGGLAAFCSGEGPVDLNDSVEGSACTGDLAKKLFRFGLCSCTDLSVQTIFTDSFNSNDGAAAPKKFGGSIGVNQRYDASVSGNIAGTLWIGGEAAGEEAVLKAGGPHSIGPQLQVGGVTDAKEVHVDGDVFVEDLIKTTLMTVDGDLHIPPGKDFNNVTVQGATYNSQPVFVPAPCDCSDIVPVAAIVSAFKANNDNAVGGLKADQLVEAPDGTKISLPCGRYYLDGVRTKGNLALQVTKRTALFVAGNFEVNGKFDLVLDPGSPEAEIDIFVAGDVKLNGPAVLGSSKRPAAVRIYTGGGGIIDFDKGVNMSAFLYAPGATIKADNNLVVFGGLFANGFQLSKALELHYDEAILEAEGCDAPGQSCGGCGDCANPTPACKGGKCAACESNSDCCPPMVCAGGACVLPAPK